MNIIFKENSNISRQKEPVTFGIPFAPGMLKELSDIRLMDDAGETLPHGATVMATWQDHSIKWLLVDLQISISGMGQNSINIFIGKSGVEDISPKGFPVELEVNVRQTDSGLIVNTGVVEFELNTDFFTPFNKIIYKDADLLSESGSCLSLTDINGTKLEPVVHSWSIAQTSSLKKTILFQGCFRNKNIDLPLKYKAWIHFFAGKPFAKIEFTLHNTEAACHPCGVWDLGDKNSKYFKDLSFVFSVDDAESQKSFYIPEFASHSTAGTRSINSASDFASNVDSVSVIPAGRENILIFQDSSGGENWMSKSHVNSKGEIPVSFKGYKIIENGKPVSEGLRASPIMGIPAHSGVLCCFVNQFWQNFPKAMEISDNELRIRLFPQQFNDFYELQPGEQKTHTFYVGIEEESEYGSSLKWAVDPLMPDITSEYYYHSLATPRPVPYDGTKGHGGCMNYQQFVDIAVSGPYSFFKKREIIDGYGWRSFGDVYADHEAVFSKDGEEFISHYNNQFDVIKGALIQYMRTGRKEWFYLAREMGDHVADIDIYHTEKDKYQFNNGMFWHTDHHLKAETSTHRTVSEKHRNLKPLGFLGGGPSPDHNYATGLLYLYYLTGNTRYSDAVLCLASNITRYIDGPDTICETSVKLLRAVLKRIKKRGETVAARYDEVFMFDGPGRASGNALNTLLDAWLLTSDEKYLNYAENLILMSVSPEDDFVKMDLLNAELRWMYTIFLLALGRYMSVKKNAGQMDAYYVYARDVLLKYAQWMAENEYPYLDKPEILEFPNETWAAQDIRKSDIFAYAASVAPENLKERFIEKSIYFFEYSIKYFYDCDTRHFTRPLAIIMTNGMPYLEMKYDMGRGKEASNSAHIADSTQIANSKYITSSVNPPVSGFSMDKTNFPATPSVKALKKSLWQRFSLKKELDWIKMQIRARG